MEHDLSLTLPVRQRILAAGDQLLRDQGLSALTQPRVAKTAGVSQSHLTYYFPTRNDLLLAIAEYSVDQVLAGPPEPSPAPASIEAFLARLAAAVAFLPRVRMLLGLVGAADQDAAIRPAVQRMIQHLRDQLQGRLMHLGYGATPADVLVFHSAVVGLAVQNLARQSPLSQTEIREGLARLGGLLPPSSLPAPSAAGDSYP